MLPGFSTPSEDTRYFRITICLAREFSSNPLVFAIVFRDRSLFKSGVVNYIIVLMLCSNLAILHGVLMLEDAV